MSKRFSIGSVKIGKFKTRCGKYFKTPTRKYRIIIQERKTPDNKGIEKSSSFMIYDFTNKSNIEYIKNKLKRSFK